MVDAELLEKIEFQSDVPPKPEELLSLFSDTTWAGDRDVSGVHQLVGHLGSDFITARDNSGLIGFGRVLTDGVYRGWLDDIVVRDDLRGVGIGSEIVTRLLRRVRHVEEIWLGCAEDEVIFYERYGFRRFDHPAMMGKREERAPVSSTVPPNFEISVGSNDLIPGQVRELLEQASWAQDRSLSDVERLLNSESGFVVSAFSENQIVAFGRSITDFVYRAIIADVIVDESHRDKGIGNTIIEQLLEGLENVEEVWLGCGNELVDLYRKFGFEVVGHPVMRRVSRERT